MIEQNLVRQTASVSQTNLVTPHNRPFKILAIARNAFRESVRDRVLYNLVLFALLIVAAAIFLGDLSDDQEARVIVNFGLGAVLVFGAFIATFVGVGLVSKEIDKRTVFAIFAKPVGRAEFLLGKYFGLCATLALNVAVMTLGITLALLYVGDNNLIAPAWSAAFLILLELFVVTAAAILFSSFSSPNLSALLTFFVTVIGHLSASLRDFAASLGTDFAKFFFNLLYYLLPNFSHFSFVTNAANGKTPDFAYLSAAIAYALVYCSIVLTLAIVVFSRRNFK